MVTYAFPAEVSGNPPSAVFVCSERLLRAIRLALRKAKQAGPGAAAVIRNARYHSALIVVDAPVAAEYAAIPDLVDWPDSLEGWSLRDAPDAAEAVYVVRPYDASQRRAEFIAVSSVMVSVDSSRRPLVRAVFSGKWASTEEIADIEIPDQLLEEKK